MTQTTDYHEIISRVMTVREVTWGDPKRDYIVRFRGELTTDPLDVRTRLAAALQPLRVSAILQTDGEMPTILLVNDPITPIIAEVLEIETTDWGDDDSPVMARYLGTLTRDSVAAYDHLEKTLAERNLTPLFRIEEGKHAVVLLRGVNRPRRSNPWTNLVLFLLTLFSVIVVGAINEGVSPPPESLNDGMFNNLIQYWIAAARNPGPGLPFALSLLAILLAHEFGHYLAGRWHKSPVTLPYFLPLPLPPFGTLGAFIQLKAAPKNRRVLHDIGIAGPLAGLAVAIPILFYGLSLSEVNRLPLDPASMALEGNSILYVLIKYLSFGELLPAPISYGDTDPIIYWTRFIVTGQPVPLGGRDVFLHPVAFAGWVGILITGLNLIPAGQLDGGHMIYVLFGRRARRFLPYVLVALFALGFVWSGWWLWAFLISLLGRNYAEPLDQITELDPVRKWIAVFGIIVFLLVFIPRPF
ncbi:MAG TPA: site-2 protease family protein [Anaerolineales bacterium]|nr:site-2 protease family protein [Anaerolineales bacterium]